MGYSTEFNGEFTINRSVDDATYNLLRGIALTRRMKRDVAKLGKRIYKKSRATKEDVLAWEKEFGAQGEFWISDSNEMGEENTDDILDYNHPPDSQPGLWCAWLIQEDRQTIIWDGSEEFYHYTEWIKYFIKSILTPRGYTVEGRIYWQGDDAENAGYIGIVDNVVFERNRVSFYLDDSDIKRVTKIVNDYLSNPLKEIMDHKLDGNGEKA